MSCSFRERRTRNTGLLPQPGLARLASEPSSPGLHDRQGNARSVRHPNGGLRLHAYVCTRMSPRRCTHTHERADGKQQHNPTNTCMFTHSAHLSLVLSAADRLFSYDGIHACSAGSAWSVAISASRWVVRNAEQGGCMSAATAGGRGQCALPAQRLRVFRVGHRRGARCQSTRRRPCASRWRSRSEAMAVSCVREAMFTVISPWAISETGG